MLQKCLHILCRVKMMNFAWLLFKRQKCLICKEGWYCSAPKSTPDPLQQPRLTLHWEERRCLPASPRTFYFIFMCGCVMDVCVCVCGKGVLTHQIQQKRQTPFWVWDLSDAQSGKKNITNKPTTMFSFVVQINSHQQRNINQKLQLKGFLNECAHTYGIFACNTHQSHKSSHLTMLYMVRSS